MADVRSTTELRSLFTRKLSYNCEIFISVFDEIFCKIFSQCQLTLQLKDTEHRTRTVPAEGGGGRGPVGEKMMPTVGEDPKNIYKLTNILIKNIYKYKKRLFPTA